MIEGAREAVRKALKRGSPNHITDCMQKFWENQAALDGVDPLALTRLPPAMIFPGRVSQIETIGAHLREDRLILLCQVQTLIQDGQTPYTCEAAKWIDA